MDAVGSGVGDPFLAGPDVAVAEQHQPPVDAETMRRLRAPFDADACDAPTPRSAVVIDEDGDRGGRLDQPAPHGRSRGRVFGAKDADVAGGFGR
jgi:hypothetical protein